MLAVCFRKKYDICQIYVRSTARVYEVYYSHSPQSINEYLCTVRCNAAERDEKLLQTTDIEYVSEEHYDCFVGELPQDIVTGGGGDDDWVKIKVPEVDGSSLDNTNRVKNVQVLCSHPYAFLAMNALHFSAFEESSFFNFLCFFFLLYIKKIVDCFKLFFSMLFRYIVIIPPISKLSNKIMISILSVAKSPQKLICASILKKRA